MTFRIAVATFIAVFVAVAPLSAQLAGGDSQDRQQHPLELTRFFAGIGFNIAEPKEAFDDNVDVGFGVGGFVRYNLDPRGILSLRIDGSWAAYGSEKKRVPLSNTVGGRIMVDVVTTNSLFTFGIGPQITAPSGAIRPYGSLAFAGIGFTTSSSVSGSNFDDEPFASSTNYEDGTSAWVYSGGTYIHVSRQVSIDLGLRYHRGGEASYLREGSIQDNEDGSITITPLHSKTPFMVYAIGVSVQLGRRGAGPCPRILC